MMYDLQKAGMWKRISAFLFDIILLAITVMGLALVLSSILGYDTHTAQLDASRAAYEAEYGVNFDVSSEDYAALTEQQRAVYDEARADLASDEVVIRTCTLIINLTLIIITFSILLGYLMLEFLVPLLLGNGQTLGKKIFGIAVMRADGIRLSPMLLFVRTVLGKCTVETLLPVLIVIMIFFASLGISAFGSMLMLGLVLLAALPIVQLLLLAMTPARTPIHDKLAHTVTVDFASQMIFDSPEAMLEYKQRIHTERASSPEQR